MTKYIFPVAQIAMCVGAGAVYAFQKDWRHAIYWLAAATITTVVTF